MKNLKGLLYKGKIEKFQNGSNGFKNFVTSPEFAGTVTGGTAATHVLAPGVVSSGVSAAAPWLAPLLPAAGMGAVASQIGPHYRQSQATTLDPQYDTNSTAGDYTKNAAPGQQVGTGQNTGTKPEYNVGYRMPNVQSPFSGPGIVTNNEVTGKKEGLLVDTMTGGGFVRRAMDTVAGAGNALLYPMTGFANAVTDQYNGVRDNMESKGPAGPAAAPMTKHNGPGGTKVVGSSNGAKHMQGESILYEPAPYGDDPTQDLLEVEVMTGVNIDSPDKIKKLQSHLIDLGYNLGNQGADGDIGQNTLGALRHYIRDNKDNNYQDSSAYTKKLKTEAFRSGQLGGVDAFGNPIDRENPKVGGVLPGETGGEASDFQGQQMKNFAQHLTDPTYGVGDERMGVMSSDENKDAEFKTQDYTGWDDKEAYDYASIKGNKVYTKDGEVKGAGKQGSKYEDRDKSKKKPIVKKEIKRTGDTYSDGRNKADFDKAYATAKRQGKSEFKFSNGKSYSTGIKKDTSKNKNKDGGVSTIKSKGVSTKKKPITKKTRNVKSIDAKADKGSKSVRKVESKDSKDKWQNYSKDRQVGEAKMKLADQAKQLKAAGRKSGTFVNGKLQPEKKKK